MLTSSRRSLVALCTIAFGILAVVTASHVAGQNPPAVSLPADNYLVGAEVCGACHGDKLDHFSDTPHLALLTDPRFAPEQQGCEACHGPGGFHTKLAGDPSQIVNPRKLPAREVAAICTTCHVEQSERRAPFHTEHDPDVVGCNDCHSPHQEKTNPFLLVRDGYGLCLKCHKEVESEFRKPFHHKVLEGGITCRECHSGHGERNSVEARRSAEGINSLCASCHADKHGPFVFEHLALKRSEDGCVTCHSPHGSVNNRMLVRSNVFQLCIQCHSEIGLSKDPGKGVFTHDLGNPRFRNCTTCHTQIHGSNSSRVFLI